MIIPTSEQIRETLDRIAAEGVVSDETRRIGTLILTDQHLRLVIEALTLKAMTMPEITSRTLKSIVMGSYLAGLHLGLRLLDRDPPPSPGPPRPV